MRRGQAVRLVDRGAEFVQPAAAERVHCRGDQPLHKCAKSIDINPRVRPMVKTAVPIIGTAVPIIHAVVSIIGTADPTIGVAATARPCREGDSPSTP